MSGALVLVGVSMGDDVPVYMLAAFVGTVGVCDLPPLDAHMLLLHIVQGS